MNGTGKVLGFKAGFPVMIRNRRIFSVDKISALVLLLLATLLSVSGSASEFRLVDASITDLQKALTKGNLTSIELVKRYLLRIEAYDQQNPELNAIIRINPDALTQAAELDRERAEQGARGPLHGIPVIVKDNFNTQGLPTTAGSVAFAGFIPTRDADQVARLKQAGAIILAKANMDELARDVRGNSSLGGQTRNPYDLSRNPGGSSAGTAVAVAANFASLGLGTDTCGSIRVPASFNALVGLRPSKGLSTIEGIMPLSVADDVAGPLARSVRDLATVLDVVALPTPSDTPNAQAKKPAYVAGLKQSKLGQMRLGKLGSYFDENGQTPTNKVLDQALETLQSRGLTLVDIDSALFDSLLAALTEAPPVITYQKDMADYLADNPIGDYQSVLPLEAQGLYHEFIDDWIPFKTFIQANPDAEQRYNDSRWRSLLSQAVDDVLRSHRLDALIYPSVKFTPAKIGEAQLGNNCGLSAYSGAPALSLPVGFTATGLPVGLELLGAGLSDEKLVATGYAIEQALNARRPPANTPPLIEGRAPEPISFTQRVGKQVEITFTFDPTRSELHYQTRYLDESDIYAVCLHTAKRGPVIQCLSGPEGRRMEGTVSLNAAHRKALHDDALYLRLYAPESPKGEKSIRIKLPK